MGFVRFAAMAALLGAGALGACAPEAPNAYSPGYSRVSLGEGGADGKVRKGYDRTAAGRTALLPDACVTPDVAPDPVYLPSGCANAVNLQQMAEREEDLVRGQRPGPAMAAPAARAARAYVDGTGDEDRRRRLQGDDPNSNEQGVTTTSPQSSNMAP